MIESKRTTRHRPSQVSLTDFDERLARAVPLLYTSRVFRTRSLLVTAPLFLVALTLPGWAEADIYQYTDADGIIHFRNTPGPNGQYKLYLKTQERKKSANVTPVMPSDTSIERFSRYDEWIRQAATLYQIPEELVRAVIMVESNYDARAVSPAGAMGLMQMMPETAHRMEVRDIFDPRENIFGGTRYLRVLANLFNGDLQLTIAAYNAGEGAVTRHGGIPPYAETQDYVVKVLTYYRRYRSMNNVVEASGGQLGCSMDLDEFESRLAALVHDFRARSENIGCVQCERCEGCERCTFCSDSIRLVRCQYCVACVDCTECSHCHSCSTCVACVHCVECESCRNCAYVSRSIALVQCTYCYGCIGLVQRDFHILNEPYERRDYFAIVSALSSQLEARYAQLAEQSAEAEAPAKTRRRSPQKTSSRSRKKSPQ
ncbi:MAG: lytic transglycosylase domain-containing protein [Polyangiaceae bacterium]